MREAADYRKYAEECEELAKKIPKHRATLLEMAKAWRARADGGEQKLDGGQRMEDERKEA